ncbi:hypothetical protein SAMN05518865_110253 [Duganella sp. CF458]|uniref:hypothetical protein n=1 Tax=Duganella sp. CF458 TaxID=1884368 RepID=UPI0008E40A95|nr:hypothetical protein [Duganella sp. CF458]SFG31382.1 hypothetical protein SAMN05518865_110253 [Duganella sp. CF458]
MAQRRTPPLVDGILGAMLGGVMGAAVKGSVLAWNQADPGWGLVSALLGLVTGPFMLALDLLALFGKGLPGNLEMLSWSGIGVVIGAFAGYLSNKDQ